MCSIPLGNIADITDPNGIDTHTVYDVLGRPTQVVDDYGGTGHLNNTTDFAYGPAGMTSQTSEQPGGVNQTTAWIYGVTTAGGSAIDSNDVVSAIEYPDPTTGVAAAVML